MQILKFLTKFYIFHTKNNFKSKFCLFGNLYLKKKLVSMRFTSRNARHVRVRYTYVTYVRENYTVTFRPYFFGIQRFSLFRFSCEFVALKIYIRSFSYIRVHFGRLRNCRRASVRTVKFAINVVFRLFYLYLYIFFRFLQIIW